MSRRGALGGAAPVFDWGTLARSGARFRVSPWLGSRRRYRSLCFWGRAPGDV